MDSRWRSEIYLLDVVNGGGRRCDVAGGTRKGKNSGRGAVSRACGGDREATKHDETRRDGESEGVRVSEWWFGRATGKSRQANRV